VLKVYKSKKNKFKQLQNDLSRVLKVYNSKKNKFKQLQNNYSMVLTVYKSKKNKLKQLLNKYSRVLKVRKSKKKHLQANLKKHPQDAIRAKRRTSSKFSILRLKGRLTYNDAITQFTRISWCDKYAQHRYDKMADYILVVQYQKYTNCHVYADFYRQLLA